MKSAWRSKPDSAGWWWMRSLSMPPTIIEVTADEKGRLSVENMDYDCPLAMKDFLAGIKNGETFQKVKDYDE